MKKPIILTILVIALATGYQFRDSLIKQAGKLETPIVFDFISNLQTKDTLPGPFRLPDITEVVQPSHLTTSGVVTLTNKERTNNNLPALKTNPQLAAAAESKITDMFSKGYFEHESPEGKGPADLAKDAGYAYVIVGENLALGNFADDAALVEGWMNSPGHRANILNEKYLEIGVAVRQGVYEGRKTWMAVQEFGTPLSSCPTVDAEIKTAISTNESQIKILEAEALEIKAELESNQYKHDPETYNKRVGEYNSLVKQLNALVETTKGLVTEYNAQVAAFNACIAK